MRISHFIIFIGLLSLLALEAMGRQNISLVEVARLNLTMISGGLSDGRHDKKYEVVNENGLWKSYQLKDSSTRIFIKDIQGKELEQLLSIINLKDTSIRMELFNIKHEEIALAFDSLINTKYYRYTSITPTQKTAFLDALKDKKRIERTLRQVIIPFAMDDKDEYKITITTKSRKTKSIAAYSFTIYNLPWNIDGEKIYDPNISRIFASLSGDKHFDKQFKGFLYQSLMLRTFWDEFQTPFTWENLKKEFPSEVAKLRNTLHVNNCFKNEYGWGAELVSSLLPEQLLISTGFRRPDTIFPEIKRLEKRLVNLHQQNNYLFKYLVFNPKLRAEAIVTENNSEEDNDVIILNKIKAKYKKYPSLKFEQVTFIDLYMVASVARGTWADKWILLPDNSLIVIPYKRPGANQNHIGHVYNKKGELLETLTDLNLPLP